MTKQSNLRKIVKPYTDKILWIKKRLYFQLDLVKKIEKECQGKRFNIRNDTIWQLISDSNDMLIIEMSSLAKSMVESGGFFAQLKNNAKLLRIPSPKKIEVDAPSIICAEEITPEKTAEIKKKSIDQRRAKFHSTRIDCFERLFPERKNVNTGDFPNHSDIDNLKDTVYEKLKPIIDDRNDNRAHRFQLIKENKATPAVSLMDLEEKFKILESFFNDLTLLSDLSRLMFSDMNQADTEQTASRLV